MGNNHTVLLAAGGTGGHIFSALALANFLKKNDLTVYVFTDHRFGNYRYDSNYESVEYLPIRSPSSGKFTFLYSLLIAYFKAFARLRSISPMVVVGFGGYPTLPTLAAAVTLRIPVVLHESNAVIGRVNKLFIPFARFLTVAGYVVRSKSFRDKMIFTGNPVTGDVKKKPYFTPKSEINLVVVGGSQGASFFAQVVPKALALMDKSLYSKLYVVHQCRIEDLNDVRELYSSLNIKARVDTFFVDMIGLIEKSHLIICRAGSGTITEVCGIGRPAIYVPYPHSRDNHQLENAKSIEKRGAGVLLEQKDANPERLCSIIMGLLKEPEKLKHMANAYGDVTLLESSRSILKLLKAFGTGHAKAAGF